VTENELIKEHLRYWNFVKEAPSAVDTLVLWARGEGAEKKAARQIWPTLSPEMKMLVEHCLCRAENE